MNQRSAKGGRGSEASRGDGVAGSRVRQDNIYSHQISRPGNITGHQSSRFGDMSGDARQASPSPPPVRTVTPSKAKHTAVDVLRSRTQLTANLNRPTAHRQVLAPSVSPVQRRYQLPPVVERPVSGNARCKIASQTRNRLTRLRVDVS
jgi:hypothetical protein